MSVKQLFILGCVSLLIACGEDEKTHEEEIQQLDKAAEQVEGAKEDFLSVDGDMVTQMYKDYEQTIKVFKRYYVPDTVDPVLGRRMITYKSLKNLKNYPGQRNLYLSEADSTLKQLTDLKHDIENESLKDMGKMEEYVKLELEAAKTITAMLTQYADYLRKQQEIYDTLNPKISVLVDSLVSANQ